jgi:hypothetical protein
MVTMYIGQKVILRLPVLGNPDGAVGYVFNEYDDFDFPGKLGLQIIFPNGNYDGFSVIEQELCLDMLDIEPSYANYKFRNVMQVSRDFNNGYWRF